MKKALYLAFLLLISSITSGTSIKANPSQESSKQLPSYLSNQWRLGLGLAAEYLNMDAKVKIRPDPGMGLLGNIASDQSQTGKHFQVAPCIEIGKTFSKDYYLGLLLSWRYSGLKSSSRSPIFQSFYFQNELSLTHYTDALIKAGYQFTPRSMIYGLIGPTLTQWRHTSNQMSDNTLINKLQTNKTDVGLGFGIGFEYLFKKDYAFSIDFVHHLHRPASKNYFLSYSAPINAFPLIIGNFAGDVNKKIDLSFSTIAARFTTFFSL